MLKWLSARPDSALADAASALFFTRFGAEPVGVWAAPGRVNLIGEHIDYAGGISLPFALRHNTAVAAAPRSDGMLRIASDYQGTVMETEIPLASVRPGYPADWSGYVAGTVWAGLESGAIPRCEGLDLAIVSDVPVGSGLSSSAALECSVAEAAFELATGAVPTSPQRSRLVQAAIRAENEVVGASTGGLDQNASIFGAEGTALYLDFATGEMRHVPFNIGEKHMVLLIADTNAKHNLADGQYASRRGVIDAFTEAMAQRSDAPIHTIRDIPDAVAKAAQWAEETGQDVDLVTRRVRHVVEETQRTADAAAALEAGDFERFAEYMRDSHVSLRDLYEVTVPELDSAFEAAGQLGVRMTGGGFGGSVIALIDADEVEFTAEAIARAAASRGFPEPTFIVASPGAGARRLR
ncbi:MAG: galactokinase [Corynebacterium sp.]|nr:galactokinase [Corynebacterium sp.]